MLHFFWNLVMFVVTLSTFITVHEFGHFWIARCCGVKVERFSIGFGRALWCWQDKHGTEYIIAAIPLGGYVKMLDEQLDIVITSECHNTAFNQKAVWQRMLIIAAGPAFNFLFAIVTYWLVFIIGVPSYRPVISKVIPHSIAAQAGISSGMELKSVNGIETPDWASVRLQLINKIGDNEIIIGITPFGSQKIERKTLNLRNWQFEPNTQDITLTLGMVPLGPCIEPIIAEVQPDSAAMKAGLKVGDMIIRVNGHPVTTWQCFVTSIRDNPGRLLQIVVDRYGKTKNINLQPDTKITDKEKIEGFAGVVPKIILPSSKYKIIRQYNPLVSLIRACEKIWQLTRLTCNMLSKLVTGNIKLHNLSGPISVAHGAGISAECGLVYYLMYLALISINLGVVNLFPLPILDGGYLFFLMIEKLKGEPISKQVRDFSYHIGLILLVLLMGIALFNDLSRLMITSDYVRNSS